MALALALALTVDDVAQEGPHFSTLELRDHVVIMALFDQLVSESEVEAVWRVWRMRHLAFFQEPFWRLLLLLPSTSAEQLYEQAARVADIETAYLGRNTVFTAIRHVKHVVSRSAWKELAQALIVPVAERGYGQQSTGMIFATNDTTNPRVRRLIDRIWTEPYELRYAPKKELLGLLQEERKERLTSTELPGE